MSQAATLSGRGAVIEALPENRALKAILEWNEKALLDAKYDRDELTLTVAPEAVRDACRAVQTAGYNFFEDMTAVDWFPASPRFQLSYHILSFALKERVRLRVLLEDTDPSIASIVPIWQGANFFEREVFDLFGIRFEGHPDLRRIMMPDDWKGYPMRKDYPVEGYR